MKSDKTGRGEIVTSILQTYLRHNLLDLEGEDARLEKLNAAATEFADALARAPENALGIFLAAVRPDEELGASLNDVASAIENNWNTYHGAFRDGKALTLYKAVALQAIVEAISLQPVLGTAISLLMRNFGPRIDIGKNKEAFDILVSAADAAFAAEVEASPPIVQNVTVPKPTKANTFDRAVLKKRIEAAVGPHDRASQPGENPNPQFPNSGAAWSFDFADRMTTILADYLETVWAKAFENDSKYIAAINQLNSAASQNAQATNLSISLLWWRQALYSETAKQPYRELKVSDAVAHIVLDLSALIPVAYNRALESFLIEAVLSLLPSQEEIPGSQLLAVLPAALTELKSASDSFGPSGLMLSAIVHGDAAAGVVKMALPAHKWAVWLLRELKALQALTNPRPVPEKEGNDD